VATPNGRLSKLDSALTERPCVEVKENLRVKSLTSDGETYVYTESPERVHNERSMRRRALKKYWQSIGGLAGLQRIKRDEVLIRVGQARQQADRIASSLLEVEVDAAGRLSYRIDRAKPRDVRRREGRYLLRTNLLGHAPDALCRYYMQLVFIDEALRTQKGDLGLRPVYHSKDTRIETHLFVAFLA
jgi:hypothetical protein